MEQAMNETKLDGAASALSDVLGLLAVDFECHPLFRSIDDCEAAGRAMREAKDTIDMLQSWEADATARAELLEQHLRYVLEIARTWTPEYAQPVDLATLNMAEMLLTPNALGQRGNMFCSSNASLSGLPREGD